MYKHFQAGNAKTICDQLNENKMKIHSIELTNGMLYCVGEPSDDNRELRSLGGSILIVTNNLNKYDREIEGKVLMKGHSAIAFYRYDEKKEAERQKEIDEAARKAREEQEIAEKEAKKAEMKKQLEELKAKMEKVDSEMTDSQKQEAEEKAKAEKLEAKRQAELKKQKEKEEKMKAELKKKKEESLNKEEE